jgi:hypothetical protein
MEIVAVHTQAIRTPRRLTIDSFPRLTNNDGLHLQATNLETGEPWIIRHSAIYIPSEDMGGIPPDWCAYPLADADLSKVGGFVPPAVARFDRIGLVDLPTLIEDLHGYQVIQAREPLPANSYYAVLRITDVASHIQIALVRGAKSADIEETFIPPIVRMYYDPDIGGWGEEVQPDFSVIPVHQYGDRITDVAVVIPGVEYIDPDIKENEIGRWAKPLTSQQVAERLLHVAEHLEQIANPALQDSVPEELRSGRSWQPTPGWENSDFGLGVDQVMEAKLGSIQRALVNLAPHCGAEQPRISEIATQVLGVVQRAEAYRKADLVAGAIGLGKVQQPNFTWAQGSKAAATHVRDCAGTLAAQNQVGSQRSPLHLA